MTPGERIREVLLTETGPEPIRKRVCERPEVIGVVAWMSDKEMDLSLKQFGSKS